MAVHAEAAWLHHQGRARGPHRAAEQGRGTVRPGQLQGSVRLVQHQPGQPRTSTAARAATCLDLVIDLLPAFLILAVAASRF
jgi:hypothetical protein